MYGGFRHEVKERVDLCNTHLFEGHNQEGVTRLVIRNLAHRVVLSCVYKQLSNRIELLLHFCDLVIGQRVVPIETFTSQLLSVKNELQEGAFLQVQCRRSLQRCSDLILMTLFFPSGGIVDCLVEQLLRQIESQKLLEYLLDHEA